MDRDRDLTESGEALLAALQEGGRTASPTPALRERVLRAALRRERRLQSVLGWPSSAFVVGAVAVVVLLVATLAWGISANQTLARDRTLLAQLQDAAAKDEIVFEIVDGRNVTKNTLRPPIDDSPTAPYGKLFTRPDMPYVVAMAGRLPPAPPGQEYHLYLDDRRIGSIEPNENGFGYFVYRDPAVGVNYRQARLVLEQPQTTTAAGTVVLVWSAN